MLVTRDLSDKKRINDKNGDPFKKTCSEREFGQQKIYLGKFKFVASTPRVFRNWKPGDLKFTDTCPEFFPSKFPRILYIHYSMDEMNLLR